MRRDERMIKYIEDSTELECLDYIQKTSREDLQKQQDDIFFEQMNLAAKEYDAITRQL